jgi:hypothetical protein
VAKVLRYLGLFVLAGATWFRGATASDGSDSEDDDNRVPEWVYIVGSICVVVVIALCFVYHLTRKKEEKPPEKPADPDRVQIVVAPQAQPAYAGSMNVTTCPADPQLVMVYSPHTPYPGSVETYAVTAASHSAYPTYGVSPANYPMHGVAPTTCPPVGASPAKYPPYGVTPAPHSTGPPTSTAPAVTSVASTFSGGYPSDGLLPYSPAGPPAKYPPNGVAPATFTANHASQANPLASSYSSAYPSGGMSPYSPTEQPSKYPPNAVARSQFPPNGASQANPSASSYAGARPPPGVSTARLTDPPADVTVPGQMPTMRPYALPRSVTNPPPPPPRPANRQSSSSDNVSRTHVESQDETAAGMDIDAEDVETGLDALDTLRTVSRFIPFMPSIP